VQCLFRSGVVALKIKAVLFDLRSTLVKTWTPEITYKSLLSSFGIDRSTKAVKEAIEARAQFVTCSLSFL
jgi:FMN phosphatase YigB (HAD superfamily)